jgi:hypothetical protein
VIKPRPAGALEDSDLRSGESFVSVATAPNFAAIQNKKLIYYAK